MECDMCGKQATAMAEIEGAKLAVCDACGKHGRIVKQLPRAAPKGPASARPVVRSAPIREQSEISEQVRKDLPEILRKEREKRKMTHEEFSAILNVRASTYHHFESGAILPDVELARRIEHALKIPIVQTVKTIKGEWKNDTDAKKGLSLGDFIKTKKK